MSMGVWTCILCSHIFYIVNSTGGLVVFATASGACHDKPISDVQRIQKELA